LSEPHGSLAKFAAGFGADGGADMVGEEMLNALFGAAKLLACNGGGDFAAIGACEGVGLGGAVGVGAMGELNEPKRSFIPLLAAGWLLGTGGKMADEKSPKSPPKLSLGCLVLCVGGEVGFGGGAGLVSKKLPPESGLGRVVAEGWRA